MITTNEKDENMLTGLKEEWFSIEEMEVFKIEKIHFTIAFGGPKNYQGHPLTFSYCLRKEDEHIFLQYILQMNDSATI